MQDNRNLILAIALSLAVLFAWQFFIAGPEIDRARRQQQAQEQSITPPQATLPQTAAPAASAEAATLPREEALTRSTRVRIATASLAGSINLTGARIDDLHLTEFHETVDPASPTIVLLSPSGAEGAYFAEFGWTGGSEAGPLPGRDTVWSAPANAMLTPAAPLKLTWDNGAGLAFTRTVAVDDKYMFTVTDEVTNTGTTAVTLAPTGRITRAGPIKTTGFWILHEGPIGVTDKLQEIGYGDVQKERERTWSDVVNGWVGITDKYWATALVPDHDDPFTGGFAYAEAGTPVYQADFRGSAKTVAPGATASEVSRLFAGAKQVAVVDGYAARYDIRLFDRLIDWGWFWFFTKPLFSAIDWFFHLFGNFGLAILAVTVLVKAAFFPLANKSYKSMSAMRKMQPQMTELRERYKDDKVKQQQALMELYKKEKINPLAGCWPMLVQIPVFFALYKVLFVTIEMRHAPFFGWVHDLAAPDPTTIFNLFGLLPFNPALVPVIGGFLTVGAWPLIMGITMFVQMKLTPPPDPAQAVIFNWMPVLFTFMLAGFPAGLVIYWAWNNTLSVTQQYIIMRRSGAEVDLFGNIRNSFRRRTKPATAPVAATTVAVVPTAANDAGEATADGKGKGKKAAKTKPARAKSS
jgi:YidC/Oxa1 family membrane protein insertase